MLLAIDIGNTAIIVGIFDDDKLKATWRLATGIHRLPDEYAALLLTLLQRQRLPSSKITGAALCSVVPPLVSVFQEICQRYFSTSPLIVEAGIKTGVRICVDNPRELGPDRVVNAVAAHHLYGEPVIVLDLGTATTFDVISKEGDYLGGAIAPGIGIASEALFTRTAMLPRIKLTRPKQAIGKNTISAMQSGIIFGYIGLIESMIQRIEQELGSKAKVVATGGYAYPLAKEIPAVEIINPDLPLIGLRLVYEMNKIER
ncbi:MAG: type III pantothenate kinase [Dehalococcoidia bacterium]|nr:type III pantothenate kinase [Dehalococcoidia bacterium]MDH5781856.1 type III pantothenate kinase [Dehalococcoidia bacterium]